MRLEKITRLEKGFAGSIHNIYVNAERFMWDADTVNKAVLTIWCDQDFRKLPQYAKSFVYGVRHQCNRLHDRLVVYGYIINGKRLTLGSAAYRKISPRYISEHCSASGAFVYRKDTSKLYYKSSK